MYITQTIVFMIVVKYWQMQHPRQMQSLTWGLILMAVASVITAFISAFIKLDRIKEFENYSNGIS